MTRASRWAVSLWLVFIVACIVIVSRTTFSTDLSAFLPRSPTPAQQVLVEQLRDGVVSRLILIGIDSDTPEALAQASKQLAAQLRKDPAFVSVSNGETAAEGRDRDYLWHNRYLLSPAVVPAHFAAAALRGSLEDDLQLLGSPAGALVKKILPADPTGELLHMIEQLDGAAKPAMQEGVWFDKAGKRALLVAQTQAAGYDIDAQERAIAQIRSAFSTAAKTHTAMRLQLTGPGVFSANTRASIQGDAWRFSVIATGLIMALLLFVYRSVRVLVLGLLPVISGALAGIAMVSLGFGAVHGITLGFGVTLIGEGVDYAIYLFTQIAPGDTPQSTFRRIWPTLLLGVVTSICGFSAMLFSGFPGLAQLGLFSIAGLIVAVTVTRWVLPALLPAGFTAQAVSTVGPRVADVLGRAPRLRYPLLVCVALCLGYLLLQHHSLWSNELASLSPVPASDRQLDEQLRNDIGAPDVRYLVVVNATNQEEVLQASETIATALQGLITSGVVQGYESPAVYLPSKAAQQKRQAEFPATATLQQDLQHALEGLPFRPDLFAPFVRDVETAKSQPLLERAALRGTALALKVDSLLIHRKQGWAVMMPLRGVGNPALIASELANVAPQAIVLDLKQESDKLYETYRHEALLYSLLGAIAIVILLAVSLRSLRRVVEVLAPLVAAVVVVTAVLVAAGYLLSIFHLVGLLLVVAVGSNYALFFDRQSASGEEQQRKVVSLVFANISTMIGFGLLGFSRVPLLHAIGITVGLGAVLSLIFSAILIVRRSPPAGAR